MNMNDYGLAKLIEIAENTAIDVEQINGEVTEIRKLLERIAGSLEVLTTK